MPVEIQQRPRCNLILHCGASAVPRMEVARVTTPKPTETWTPIPHISLLESVESSLRAVSLRIGNQSHALSADGDQYFGLIELLGSEQRDYNLVVGIRNSHNKTLPIGLVAGTSVFVCDNLSFNGSVRLMRRHTTNAQKDLPFLVSRGVGKLMQLWNQNDQRVAAYKECRIKDKTMHDLAIRAVDVEACTNRMLPLILKEWREPRYECFAEKNCWAAYNSFTEVLKGNLQELPRRTEALTGLFDTAVGLPAPHLN